MRRQYVSMYMRRRQSLASIGCEPSSSDGEDADVGGEDNAAALGNAVAQVKEFAQLMKVLNL